VLADAAVIGEAVVVERRVGGHGPTFGQRARDDAARDRRADGRQLVGRHPMTLPVARLAAVVVRELEVCDAGPRHLDDQGQRAREQRLERLLAVELEQTAIEVALGEHVGQRPPSRSHRPHAAYTS
jgi:hypothetical protein